MTTDDQLNDVLFLLIFKKIIFKFQLINIV